MCQSLSWVTKLTEQMQSVKKNSVRYLGFMDRPQERGMWPWRSWMPAPWKCSCAVCSRGKDTARASAGSPSILTDVWTVKIKEFYFSGLILFTASSWTFLIEQGKLSDRVWRWEAKSLSALIAQWWHVLFSALLGSTAAPCAGAAQHPGTWGGRICRVELCAITGHLERKTRLTTVVDFKRKWYYFLKKVLLM